MPDLFVADKNKPQQQQPQPDQEPLKPPEAQKPKLNHALRSMQNAIIQSGEHKVGFFSSFCPNPTGVEFEHQEPDEVVLLFSRRHLITNLSWILITAVLLIVPLFFPLLATLAGVSLPFSSGYAIIGLRFYYLAVIGYALLHLVVWFYNAGIVTDRRVIDIDLFGITNRNIAVAILSDIVDVEYSQKGFLATFFNYGDIHLQTEGIKTLFEYIAVPKPAKVADLTSDLMQKH